MASVLPPEVLFSMAEIAGIREDEAAERLAEMLPQVVDNLTPDGVIPE